MSKNTITIDKDEFMKIAGGCIAEEIDECKDASPIVMLTIGMTLASLCAKMVTKLFDEE